MSNFDSVPDENQELSNLVVIGTRDSQAEKLLTDFFQTTDANEVASALTEMLDTHIQHSDFDRVRTANTANLVCKLIQLFNNVEKNIVRILLFPGTLFLIENCT